MLFTCKQFYNVPPGQTQTLLYLTENKLQYESFLSHRRLSLLSVNLRFSSLLLQIKACWRRSVKGAVRCAPSCQQTVLHKHQAKQEKSRSGQVTWTHHWSGSSLDPLDSSRVQDTRRQISFFVLFFRLFQKLWVRSRPAGQRVEHQVASFPHNQLELLSPCCRAETHESASSNQRYMFLLTGELH